MTRHLIGACIVLGMALAPMASMAQHGHCYGTPGKGRVDNGVRLPDSGANFSAYSLEAVAAGRTYLHHQAAAVVVDAYARLNKQAAAVHYVYGETGLVSGGPFQPHRTHQNGLSVDFFVPVRDGAGRSAALPTQAETRYGYDIEFDKQGKYQQYRIDFPALADHLHALHAAAGARGVGMGKVIIDTDFLPQLFATARGPWLKKNIAFMMAKPWVRHDEHYHVDFLVPCKP